MSSLKIKQFNACLWGRIGGQCPEVCNGKLIFNKDTLQVIFEMLQTQLNSKGYGQIIYFKNVLIDGI